MSAMGLEGKRVVLARDQVNVDPLSKGPGAFSEGTLAEVVGIMGLDRVVISTDAGYGAVPVDAVREVSRRR